MGRSAATEPVLSPQIQICRLCGPVSSTSSIFGAQVAESLFFKSSLTEHLSPRLASQASHRAGHDATAAPRVRSPGLATALCRFEHVCSEPDAWARTFGAVAAFL